MGFDEGRLILDHEDGMYYAGETVQGVLEFQQEKPKTFRGIYVKAKGYARTHWTTSHSRRGANGKTHHYTVSHNGNEDYFTTTQYLIGSNSGDHHLEPGFHKFPFQVPIPPHCPSSFEGDYGHVRYEICVVVDRAFKFDQEKEIRITVHAPVDLNADPELRMPLNVELEESYCCWCLSSGDVKTCVRVPASGFVPGQTVNVELACDNRSNVVMQKVKMAIKQHTHFIAHYEPGQRSGDTRTIVEVKKGSIPANTSRSWTLALEVPPDTQPSGLTNCHIIDMGYVFKVTVVAEGCHSNVESERSICIGTVPLRDMGDDILHQEGDTDPLIQQNASKNNAQYSMPNNINYPGSNQPYPGVNQPYPGANSPYPGANPPFPGANPPYPGVNSPYSVANPPYPGANPPYAGVNPPYPGVNSPYPGVNPPYPGANPPYPGLNPPYLGANPPYPGANQQYNSNGNFPYNSSGSSQHPIAPYEAQSLPYSNKKEQEATASYPNAPPTAASSAAVLHPPSYASIASSPAPAASFPPLSTPAAAAAAPPSFPPQMSKSEPAHAASTPAAAAAPIPEQETTALHSSST